MGEDYGFDVHTPLAEMMDKHVQAFGTEKMSKFSTQMEELRTYYTDKCELDVLNFMFLKTGTIMKGYVTRDGDM